MGLPDSHLWLKMWERGSLPSIRVSQVALAAPEVIGAVRPGKLVLYHIFVLFSPCPFPIYPFPFSVTAVCASLGPVAAPGSHLLSPAGLQKLMLAGGLTPLLSHTGTSVPVFGWIYHDTVSVWLHIKTPLIFADAKGGLHAQGQLLRPQPVTDTQFWFFSEFIRFKLQPKDLS